MNIMLHLLGVEVFSLSVGSDVSEDVSTHPFGFQASGAGIIERADAFETYYEDDE